MSDSNILLPDLAQLEISLAAATKNQRAWEQRAATYHAELRLLNGQLTEAESATQHVDQGACPTCNQPLNSQTQRELDVHFQHTRDTLRTRIAELNASLSEAREEAAGWKADAVSLDQELQEARETERQRRIEINTLERRRDELAALRAATLRRIRELEDAPNPHTAERKRLEARVEEAQDKLHHLVAERVKVERSRDLARMWQDGFRAIRLSIIEDTLFEVSLAANKHASRLGLDGWEIEFATSRETKQGTTSLGFNALIYPPGVDEPKPWDGYGGGVSTRWQLATMFGLGEVLLARAGIVPNVEIYDEPTRGLSSEGIGDLLDCLAERSRETGRSIFMVDHHVLSQGSFDNVVTVVKNAEGSRIVQ